MKNIILQHFDGELRRLDRLSMLNISAYASRIGAEYELVTGKPFRDHLTSPCQKASILNEKWDKYDNVLMLDIDCFVAKGLEENIFDVKGHGVHGPTQARLKNRLVGLGRINQGDPYWAGSIYKFDRRMRKAMRSCMPAFDKWMDIYNKAYYYEDEGILAELASHAKIMPSYLDFSWNQCSFLPDPDKAKILHIRTKKFGQLNGSWENGGKQDKLLNYQELVDKGII